MFAFHTKASQDFVYISEINQNSFKDQTYCEMITNLIEFLLDALSYDTEVSATVSITVRYRLRYCKDFNGFYPS